MCTLGNHVGETGCGQARRKWMYRNNTLETIGKDSAPHMNHEEPDGPRGIPQIINEVEKHACKGRSET